MFLKCLINKLSIGVIPAGVYPVLRHGAGMTKRVGMTALLMVVLVSSANAAISFKINDRDIPKVKILISGSAVASKVPTQNPGGNQAKNDLENILIRIKNNLRSTNLFDIAQKDQISGVTQDDLSIEKVPDFAKYSTSGIGMLLVINANYDQVGNLEIKIRLWDVLDERQIFGKFYSASSASYKKVASMVSDEIFKAATGEKAGFFDSKIIYIAESGNALKRTKRIAMMDFDGENRRYLTNGRDLVLTPVFSKKTGEILFVRFFGEKPQIYSLDLNNLLVRKIGGFRGTTFAPAINPQDQNVVVFSIIENGNSNIYKMNLLTNEITRLTNTRAIDTTPSYSPDGSKIVFSSDRSGSEQIYIMNADGGGLNKITNNDGSYSKPVWSPDGQFIAFTKIKSGQFSIGIMSVDGRSEKTITSGYLVESAKWSPNGRYLIYSRKDGAYGKNSIPRLYIVDVLTGFERELPTAENEGATDPEWTSN